MPKSFDRMERVTALIQQQLSRLIHQERICQGRALVTISHIEVSRDLSQARVFVQTLDAEPDEVLDVLNQAAKFLRSRLSKLNHLRQVPQLRFFRDVNLENQFRLGQLLSHMGGN